MLSKSHNGYKKLIFMTESAKNRWSRIKRTRYAWKSLRFTKILLGTFWTRCFHSGSVCATVLFVSVQPGGDKFKFWIGWYNGFHAKFCSFFHWVFQTSSGLLNVNRVNWILQHILKLYLKKVLPNKQTIVMIPRLC